MPLCHKVHVSIFTLIIKTISIDYNVSFYFNIFMYTKSNYSE